MKKNVKLAVASVFAVAVLVFAVQNIETVEVEFLLWTLSGSRALILFVVFLVGAAAGWLARGAKRR